ncbi:hypothetical protein EGJ52_24405 [Pseudomonas luteola]|uniref:hypothetical protein n=1 Tax=Pseudomonas luteola TaxID=47886 RepID=UPI000F787B2F|nr:hypothetical protein [Pseudomonas luteola]RRW39537.1 hypothetical protein EGJ52_24405 [Pseudomonas luteola]
MEWFTLGTNRSETAYDAEAWKRTIGVDEETGEVHVACAVAGDEHVLAVYAIKHGQTVTLTAGHRYVPAKWLTETFPFSRETLAELLSETSRLPAHRRQAIRA